MQGDKVSDLHEAEYIQSKLKRMNTIHSLQHAVMLILVLESLVKTRDITIKYHKNPSIVDYLKSSLK